MSDALRVFTLYTIPSTDKGTFGIWTDEQGYPLFCTVERPWVRNQGDVSCIPAGEYLCRRRFSEKNGFEVFEVTGVQGRTDIELHPANIMTELLGCIAPGFGFDTLNGYPSVQNSKAKFAQFMHLMGGIDHFKLVIKRQ